MILSIDLHLEPQAVVQELGFKLMSAAPLVWWCLLALSSAFPSPFSLPFPQAFWFLRPCAPPAVGAFPGFLFFLVAWGVLAVYRVELSFCKEEEKKKKKNKNKK